MMKQISYTVIIFVIILAACSKSGKRRHNNGEIPIYEKMRPAGERGGSSPDQHGGENIVKMTKNNGVYEIPTEVNGIQMHFIFDTGAGMISMSNTEAIFLYKQGKLTDKDVVGNANFIDANGNVSEGMVVRLREVKVGNKVLKNIEASIVPNLKAPLLFGQSALEKFGKVSIDYTNEQITFQ